MLHTTYLSMKHLELYVKLKREDKIRQRQIGINNRADKFRELETPRHMNAWGVTEELKKESYNEWVKLINQMDVIIDEQIKHMIVYSF